jgi:DivIVA domain-containing protein
MTGDEIRRVTFRAARGYGYRASDVDEVVEQLANLADLRLPLGPLATQALFRNTRRGGYDTGDVDRFLEQVAREG